jgi:hypothetical protein
MMNRVLALAMMLTLASLGGCEHKDLTAPCARDSNDEWFSNCGRLRPVNSWAGQMTYALGVGGRGGGVAP